MANQVKTKFIANDAVTSEKLLLDNNSALRSKDSGGSTQSLMKIDGTDKVMVYRSTGAEEIAYKSDVDGGGEALQDHLNDSSDAHDASAISCTPSGDIAASNVQSAIEELDSEKLSKSGGTMSGTLNMNSNTLSGLSAPTANGQPLIYDQVGAASGIAPLNSSSKIDATYLPSYVDDVLEYDNLAAFPATGETGKIYVAKDNGKTYRWSGSTYVEISASEVNSVNGATGVVTLTTSNISEGSNQYFTDSRAKSAAVNDTAYGSSWNGVTDVAPSKNAVYDEMELAKGRISSIEGVSSQLFKKTLDSSDISAKYIDLPYTAVQTNDMHVFADRLALHQGASEDFTLSIESGVTRITFINELVSPGSQQLQVGDNIYVRYKK